MQPIRPPAAPVPPIPAAPAASRDPAAGAPAPAGPAPAAEPPLPNGLWSSLTAEEQGFFARLSELGPLTYGPAARRDPAPPAPTGQRIDVRA